MSESPRDPNLPDVHESDCPRAGEDSAGTPCTCPADSAEQDVILRSLRRHTIGAFNGTQVACEHCRLWMKTDEWHQHLAELIERALENEEARRG